MKKIDTAQRKKIIVSGCLLLFAVVLAYNSFESSISTTVSSQIKSKPHPDRIPSKSLESQSSPKIISNVPASHASGSSNVELLSSLDFKQLGNREFFDNSRNLFAYVPPPPPPPPKPTPPPPITLHNMSPNNIYARTDQTFELVVHGSPFKPGLNIYIDNVPVTSTFISSSELHAMISPHTISSPRNAYITVKDPTSPEKMNSTSLSFQILDPPRPTVKYFGWISEKGGKNPGAVISVPSSNGEDRRTVHRGEIVSGRFRVASITITGIDFEDVTLSGVHHSIQMEGGGSASSPSPVVSSSFQPYSPPQSYPQYNDAQPAYSDYYENQGTEQPQPHKLMPRNTTSFGSGEARPLIRQEGIRPQNEESKINRQLIERHMKDVRRN